MHLVHQLNEAHRITVENPDGVQKGVREILADGSLIAGITLPVSPPGSTVEVRVVMG